MSHSIKIQDPTYQRLVAILQVRETFDQAVTRLLDCYQGLRDMSRVIQGNREYQEYARRKQDNEMPKSS